MVYSDDLIDKWAVLRPNVGKLTGENTFSDLEVESIFYHPKGFIVFAELESDDSDYNECRCGIYIGFIAAHQGNGSEVLTSFIEMYKGCDFYLDIYADFLSDRTGLVAKVCYDKLERFYTSHGFTKSNIAEDRMYLHE